MVKGTSLRSPHQLIQAAVTHVTSRRVIEGLPCDPMEWCLSTVSKHRGV